MSCVCGYLGSSKANLLRHKDKCKKLVIHLFEEERRAFEEERRALQSERDSYKAEAESLRVARSSRRSTECATDAKRDKPKRDDQHRALRSGGATHKYASSVNLVIDPKRVGLQVHRAEAFWQAGAFEHPYPQQARSDTTSG